MNIKNGNVVTANCNSSLKLKHFIFEISLYLFPTHGFLVFYNELLITEVYEYGNRRQKAFPKIVITKIVIKNSYVLETFQNDNKDKVKPFQNSILFFGKFADSRHNV